MSASAYLYIVNEAVIRFMSWKRRIKSRNLWALTTLKTRQYYRVMPFLLKFHDLGRVLSPGIVGDEAELFNSKINIVGENRNLSLKELKAG